MGVSNANEIVNGILSAFVSSSDETLFGNEFFEPLATWAAKEAFHGKGEINVAPGSGAGFDLIIESPKSYKPIAIKSGPHVFNAQSRKKQSDQFNELRQRMLKLKKMFDPVVGYAYGRKQVREGSKESFRQIAGQEFWAEITGEVDFYLRVIELMKQKPQQHAIKFKREYDKTLNRLTKEFLNQFSNGDGSINWIALVKFNSAKVKPSRG